MGYRADYLRTHQPTQIFRSHHTSQKREKTMKALGEVATIKIRHEKYEAYIGNTF